MAAIPAPNNKEPLPPREPGGGFPVLPLGWYRAQIISAQVKPLKSGNGTGLELDLGITSPGYVNRKAWGTLNVNHTNPKTEQIGQQELQELIEACGFTRQTFHDDFQLNGRNILVRLKIEEARGNYPARNQIAGFAPESANKTLVPPPSGAGGTRSTPWAGGQQQQQPAQQQASQPAQQSAPAQTQATASGSGGSTAPWLRGKQ
jgi:hypothetical protein